MNYIEYEDILQKTIPYVKDNCRLLEYFLLQYLFVDKKYKDNVINELLKFQNDDGGFGHGLEPDALFPSSSAIDTTIAIQILDMVDYDEDKILQSIVKYFENTYDDRRKGWYSVPKEVNDYPHAVWWNYDKVQKGTQIDTNWGNPTIEIIGFLYKNKKFLSKLDINSLIKNTIDYINDLNTYDSEHELYCIQRFYNNIDNAIKSSIKEKVENLIKNIIITNTDEWDKYGAEPRKVIYDSNSVLYTLFETTFNENLDYIINRFKGKFIWLPNWEWYQYEEYWKQAKNAWIGIITVNTLKQLSANNRIKVKKNK